MARYFFDINGCGTAEWDDVGIECASHAEVEQRTRNLLAECLDQPDAGAYGHQAASAIVRLENDDIVLTATAKPGEPTHLRWSRS
ncbi:DUF6894 family protein [Methylobacterium iners]|uniref:DUF6894 family protein n=1 Tax=Methylobacterium iners TaxID=418707 RepID=UPI0035A249F0